MKERTNEVAQVTNLENTRGAVHDTEKASLLLSPKITLREAASHMGISVSTLRRTINSGDLPVIRLGGKLMLLTRDIDEFLKQHYGRMTTPTPPVRRYGVPEKLQRSDVLTLARGGQNGKQA